MMSNHTQMAFQSPALSTPGHRQMGSADMRSPHPNSIYSPQQNHPGATTLPPFSSIETMGRGQPSNVSSMRYAPADPQQQRARINGPETASGSKRAAPTASAVTSADSTDAEDDDEVLSRNLRSKFCLQLHRWSHVPHSDVMAHRRHASLQLA